MRGEMQLMTQWELQWDCSQSFLITSQRAEKNSFVLVTQAASKSPPWENHSSSLGHWQGPVYIYMPQHFSQWGKENSYTFLQLPSSAPTHTYTCSCWQGQVPRCLWKCPPKRGPRDQVRGRSLGAHEKQLVTTLQCLFALGGLEGQFGPFPSQLRCGPAFLCGLLCFLLHCSCELVHHHENRCCRQPPSWPAMAPGARL